MTAMVLAKENGIAHWRDLMGPTKTYRYYSIVFFISYSVCIDYISCNNMAPVCLSSEHNRV